jgi:sec-independent protein translocase protein TatB
VIADIGFGELLVLAVLAIFIFGPEKLPEVAAQAGRWVRQVRSMAQSARDDLRGQLGPEFDDLHLDDLNPRSFVRRHLWEDDEVVNTPPTASATQPPLTRPASSGPAPIRTGERPPYDADAT